MHQRHSGFIQGPPDGPDHQYRNRGFPWLQFIWWFAAKKTQEPPRTSKNLQEPPRTKGTKLDPKSPAPHRLRRELARLGQENQLLRYRIASVVGVPNFWATHGWPRGEENS